jgi:hypothetical protein
MVADSRMVGARCISQRGFGALSYGDDFAIG